MHEMLKFTRQYLNILIDSNWSRFRKTKMIDLNKLEHILKDNKYREVDYNRDKVLHDF